MICLFSQVCNHSLLRIVTWRISSSASKHLIYGLDTTKLQGGQSIMKLWRLLLFHCLVQSYFIVTVKNKYLERQRNLFFREKTLFTYYVETRLQLNTIKNTHKLSIKFLFTTKQFNPALASYTCKLSLDDYFYHKVSK